MSPKIATSDTVGRDELLSFVRSRHRVVLITAKQDGTPQVSPVTAGLDSDGRCCSLRLGGRGQVGKEGVLRDGHVWGRILNPVRNGLRRRAQSAP